MTSVPVRVQIVVGDTLVAEAVVEQHMMGAFQPGGGLWERWARLRHTIGKPIGGAVSQRADLPRTFDVPVGTSVRRCPNCTVELHWSMNRGTGPVRRHEREWCSGRCADAGGMA